MEALQTEQVLGTLFSYLIVAIEACGGFVILVGVTRAMCGYVRNIVLRYNPEAVTLLRFRLGRCMVLALEFQVAADILKTGLSPTWQDILLLGAIIALRTVLNYFLERELEIMDPTHRLARLTQPTGKSVTAGSGPG